MRARFVSTCFAGSPLRLAALFGVSGAVVASLAMAACASSDSSTHGFVTDSGSGNPVTTGDDGGVGTVVTSGDDASNNNDGDDNNNNPPDSGNGDDDAQGDTGTGPGTDGSTTDSATPMDSGGSGPVARTCDGVITANEYGNPANGVHSYLSGTNTTTGQTWYMDWDSVNLYIAFVNANAIEPLVLYVGENASSASGISTGFSTFDGTDPSTLPFPANFVVYAKSGYSAFFTATASAWSTSPQTTPAIKVCVPTGANPTTREVVIPWSVMGGGAGLPAAFKFLGYGENGNMSSPDIYGQMPVGNPTGSGAQVTSPAIQYFAVDSTADGGGAPFANAR